MTAIYKNTMCSNQIIKGFCSKTNNERDEVRTRDEKATLFALYRAYCQNTLHTPDKTFTHIKNKVLITTDLMHLSTFSTCICRGGYRERRQMSPQLCVLLPHPLEAAAPIPVTQPKGFVISTSFLWQLKREGTHIKLRKSVQPEVN